MRLLVFIFSLISPMLLAQGMQESLRAVKSGYDEQNPVLSPDGKTLFFTIGNHPSNIGGKKDAGDIWFSRKEGSQWSTPVHAGPLLNDRAYNAVAGFSADGSQLFLHGHYGSSGTPAKTQGISVAQFNGSGWSRPENITIPYFLNKSGILGGAMSPDNSVFVFSAESYGTLGVDDIYVTVKQNGRWTEPKNLGSSINTQFQELTPSISDDNTTLFFSSNGRKGSGSFDIYSATRLDDSWTNWSAPVNLGPQVNTEGRELFYRSYPSRGYALFTTTTSSDGYGDIRMGAPDQSFPARDTIIYASVHNPAKKDTSSPVVVQPNLTTDANNEKTISENVPAKTEVRVYGKITNAKTGEVIPARISFHGPDVGPVNTEADAGGYSVSVPSSQYTIRIEANGYISALEKLDINVLEMQDLEMHFKLQPVEIGTTVNLKNVLFVQAKTDILPESYPELDLVVNFLKENPRVRIELMGHTDGRGVHSDNVRLSQQRANKVKEYLVSKGIDAKRITGKGFGGTRPIASNDTEESRRMNRRVEFVIKKF
jgi:OmpA-OmpF porin, OOP family